MADSNAGRRIRGSLRQARRQLVRVSPSMLVSVSDIEPGRTLPLVIQPAVEGVNLVSWATDNKEFIESLLLKAGGLLFRGFNIRSVGEFEVLIERVCGSLQEYCYRSTPRTHVSGKIYTSTEYPPGEAIPLHNEQSYSTSWPMRICFFCIEPAAQGGETPLADSRKVCGRIAPSIIDRFAEKGVMYVRNYSRGLDLSLQDVFQTSDRATLEEYCVRASIDFRWGDNGSLRTQQTCQAVAKHPQTGEMVWFNQAHLFHVSSLQAEVRESLLSSIGQESLPRNAYYGDGAPIEDSSLAQIRDAYLLETVSFKWQRGDMLMLDNMLIAHGRAPYAGTRRILVGIA
jgi:alpha-ketoglutarate-dependent taurine dioxygenase